MLFSSSAVVATGLGVAGAVFFVGSLLLLSVGLLGEYVGRVYDEVRGRPVSLISEVHRAEVTLATQLGYIPVQNGSFAVPIQMQSQSSASKAA
jgi:dolichol-phosphate mannosyltransferase